MPTTENLSDLAYQPAAGNARMAGDRGAAGALEHGEEGALGRERGGGLRVIDSSDERQRARIIGAHLDGDDALSDRGEEFLDRQHGGGGVRSPEPLQSGEREHRRVDFAGGNLA